MKGALSPIKKYRLQVFIAPVFKVFECICELIVPFIVKYVIDYLSKNSEYDVSVIVRSCLLMFGCALLGFGFTMVSQYLSARVAADYAYDLKKVMSTHLLKLSEKEINSFGKNKTLNLFSSDAQNLSTGLNMFMRLLIRSPFLIIGTIIASFIMNVKTGFIVLFALLLCSLIGALVMVASPKRYRLVQQELDNLSSLSEDNIQGARVVRAFSQEEKQERLFNKASTSYRKRGMSFARLNALLNPLTFFFINIAIISIIYLTGYKGDVLGLSSGTAIAFMNYLTQALAALVMFSKLIISLSKANASRKRVDDFLAIEPSIVDGEKDTIDENHAIYELNNVSLSYGGEANALNNINFVLNKGERIGIIGGTGSGKSSLISLLLRFNDIDSGSIKFYNEDIKNYKLSTVRGNIALVSQKDMLYQGTIKDNLLLVNKNATDEDINKALDDALASEFVSKYNDGINHEILEKGHNLSGGQKQRLAIAKALLSNAEVLIFDDATSALDYQSDLQVRRNIKKYNKTTIMVSQRATSIKDCDRIYVLDKGEIINVGTHDYLLDNCALYKEIYDTQVKIR